MSGLFDYTSADDSQFIADALAYSERAKASASDAADKATSAETSATTASRAAESAASSAAASTKSAEAALGSETQAKEFATIATTKSDEAKESSASAQSAKLAAEGYKAECYTYEKWTAASRDQTAAYADAVKASEANTLASEAHVKQLETSTVSYAESAEKEAGLALERSTKAMDWACKTSGPVEGTEYSAKYWAQQTGSAVAGVTGFNGRAGNVLPVEGDYSVELVTGASPLDSPAFTGVPTVPLPVNTSNDSTIPSTRWVQDRLTGKASVDSVNGKANLNSPAFTGTPTAPTPLRADSGRTVPTTVWVKSLAATDAEMTTGSTSDAFVTPKMFAAYAQVTPTTIQGDTSLAGLAASFHYMAGTPTDAPNPYDVYNEYIFPKYLIRTRTSGAGMKYQELTFTSSTENSSVSGVERPHRAIRVKNAKDSYTDWSVLYGSGDVKYTPWTEVTPGGGWANLTGLKTRYRKVMGHLEIDINIKDGNDDVVLFTLPESCRPKTSRHLPCFGATGGAWTPRLIVSSSGDVRVINISSTAQLNISSIVFLE